MAAVAPSVCGYAQSIKYVWETFILKCFSASVAWDSVTVAGASWGDTFYTQAMLSCVISAPEISGKGNWIVKELWKLCVFSAELSCPQCLCVIVVFILVRLWLKHKQAGIQPYRCHSVLSLISPITRLIAQSEASVGQDTVFLSGKTSLWGPDYIWQLHHLAWLRAPFFSVSAVNTILQCVMLPVLLILFLWIQHEARLAHRTKDFISFSDQRKEGACVQWYTSSYLHRLQCSSYPETPAVWPIQEEATRLGL